LQDKFISSFELNENLKNDFKFFLKGEEIKKDDELMNIIKQDDIIEVKNIKENVNEVIELKEKEPKEQEEYIIEKDKNEKTNLSNESNKEKLTKYLDDILNKKLEENNTKFEKFISEKNDEKFEQLKTELKEIVAEKIMNIFTENEINQKILNIDNKLNQLNQDYIDFKSIKIKYFNKFIEFLDNKSGPQDSITKEPIESSQKNEDMEKLKENNNKLKEMIKKLKKEKEELKKQYEKENLNKLSSSDNTKELEKLKNENEKISLEKKRLISDKENLFEKIKKLENELKKKSEKNFQSSSQVIKVPKKYICKLSPEKNENIYQYGEVKENKLIEFNLNVKNEGKDELPNNCEIQLSGDVNGLSLEKCRTKNVLKSSEELKIKMKLKVDDLESIKLNEAICFKLKLLDDKNKDIEGAECTLNIKIEKEIQSIIDEEPSKNSITLEEKEYQELFDYINDILSIDTLGENINTFKEKLLKLLEEKKDKYEGITERTEYIQSLKEDLEEIFQ
jgi:myosin heavy subunit